MTREEIERQVMEHYLSRCVDTQEVLFKFAVGVLSTEALEQMIEKMKIPRRVIPLEVA